MPLRPAPAALALALSLSAPPALAQVHWDAGAQVGVMERLTTGGPPGSPTPTPGPVFQLQGHVALVPMVRIGAYVAHDISPVDSVPARQITGAGLRAKVAPPLLSGPWHTWAVLGVGVAHAYEPSHSVPGPSGSLTVGSAEGGILDIPVALGLGYRVRGPRDPWEISTELGCRFGVAFFGSLYDGGPRDSFALSLSVGVTLDE
jgi:hypothetical protein